jgi:DNA-binding response OmpR family regulator
MRPACQGEELGVPRQGPSWHSGCTGAARFGLHASDCSRRFGGGDPSRAAAHRVASLEPLRADLGVYISADMKSGRVLVVDDQVELAENIAEVLQGLGFETDVAISAEAGLEKIGQGGITALITDFKLPGRNGAELIEEIRRQGNRIPAMVMSAYTDDITMDRAQAAGAWLFMPKPVPLSALMEAFESLARRPAAALLVDDESALTENLAEALETAGYDVVVSGSATEALAQRRRLETAVVDYRLPDGSGIALARRLRARDPSIRILFISGYIDELRRRLPSDLSGAETMEKPVNAAHLISWIGLAFQDKTPTGSG